MSDDIEKSQEEVELVDYNYLIDLSKEELIAKYIELDERVNEWPKMTRIQVLEAAETLKEYPKLLMQGALYLENASKEAAQTIQTLKDMLGEVADYMPLEKTEEVEEETTNEGDQSNE